MPGILAGGVLSIVAGVLNGSFATPTKYARTWKWENIWSIWSVWAMLILPWALVLATVPHTLAFLEQTPAHEWTPLVLFGIGFGLAQIFFCLGIAAVGIALNFAIALGISTAFGSLVPFLAQHRDRIFTREGLWFFCGIALMLAGIIGSALAGREKERTLRGREPVTDDPTQRHASFAVGLMFSVLAGLGSPLSNFGAAFATPTVARAVRFGSSLANKYNVVWAPIYTAALLPFMIYCIYLLRKNRSFGLYAAGDAKVNWFFAFVMASLWMGSSAIYGVAMTRIGAMGPVIGWPLFMSVIIMTSSAWGFLTGEWRGAGASAARKMIFAITLLILGFCTLAYSGTL